MKNQKTHKPSQTAGSEKRTKLIVKLCRMIRLLAATPAGVTQKMFIEELGVSDKSVREYRAILREAGLPLSERREDNNTKRWFLDTDFFRTPDVPFFQDEAMALLLGQHFSTFLHGTFLEEAGECGMEKIYRHYLHTHDQELLDSLRPMLPPSQIPHAKTDEPSKKILKTLITAYQQRRQVELCYQSAKSDATKTYVIYPYYFYPAFGCIYIRGYSTKRGEICSWKLDRVHDATLTDDRFDIPADFDIEADRSTAFAAFHETQAPPTLIRIHFSASPAVQYVRERFLTRPQQIHPLPDSSFILEFTLPVTPELKRAILTFGKNAEVLEPLELREQMQDEITAMLGLYDKIDSQGEST